MGDKPVFDMDLDNFPFVVDIVKRCPIIPTVGVRDVTDPNPWTRPMAENESLDLKSPNAQRWNAVRDAARKGASCQKVTSLTRKRLYDALRKVQKQFKDYGVDTAAFLLGRGSSRTLRDLVRQTKGHPYAELLVSVMNSNPDSGEVDCLKKWVHAALDAVFDQIGHGLAGSDHFPSFFESHSFFDQVRTGLEPDIGRIAAHLIEKPDWEPRRAAVKGATVEDATAELMPMSLIGGGCR
jgi:hypothetical protein